MKIASITEVKARFSSYLEQCTQGPIIVTKNGRPTAVLLSVSNEEELERLVLAHAPHTFFVRPSLKRKHLVSPP